MYCGDLKVWGENGISNTGSQFSSECLEESSSKESQHRGFKSQVYDSRHRKPQLEKAHARPPSGYSGHTL